MPALALFKHQAQTILTTVSIMLFVVVVFDVSRLMVSHRRETPNRRHNEHLNHLHKLLVDDLKAALEAGC